MNDKNDNSASSCSDQLASRAAFDLYRLSQATEAAANLRPSENGTAIERALERGRQKVVSIMAAPTRTYGPRADLIGRGVDTGHVYRVRDGWLSESRVLPDGRTHLTQILLPGDLFRLANLFGHRSTDLVTAITEATVETVRTVDLLQVCMTHPDVSFYCLWEATEQEQRTRQWLVALAQLNAEERLCSLLLELHSKLSKSSPIVHGYDAFKMPLSQQQLSAHLGMTAVHVNRIVARLREQGVVEIKRGIATILDWQSFLTIAQAHRVVDRSA